MYSPFHELRGNYPSRSSYYDSSPAMRGIQGNSPTPPEHKKVVSIPVHYIGSDKAVFLSGSRSESASAVMIQKVMRGYMVRQSMKKIAAIRKEVDGVEKSFSNPETIELIRRDYRERLKVNEMLMRLLLRLDSVRGVDSGVRNCRKAVTKKAIALQDMVDAIVEGHSSKNFAGAEKDGEQDLDVEGNNGDSVSSDFESKENPHEELHNDDVHIILENQEGHSVSAPDSIEALVTTAEEELVQENFGLKQGLQVNDEASGDEIDGRGDTVFASVPCEAEVSTEAEEKRMTPSVEQEERMNDDVRGYEIEGKKETDRCELDGEYEGGETAGTCHGGSQVVLSGNPLDMMEGGKGDSTKSSMEGNDNVRKGQKSDSAGKIGVAKDDGTRTRELLDKMLVDNEKMMVLMTDLFERNAMQTRLLNSLSLRVEQLEKAYWCERLRRMKKRNAAMGLTDCLESTLDSWKCGKKE